LLALCFAPFLTATRASSQEASPSESSCFNSKIGSIPSRPTVTSATDTTQCGVIELEEDTFEPPPETLRGSIRTMILGVHKLNDRLMHVLDIDKACQMTEEAVVAVA
jgi:hypothetical protein